MLKLNEIFYVTFFLKFSSTLINAFFNSGLNSVDSLNFQVIGWNIFIAFQKSSPNLILIVF